MFNEIEMKTLVGLNYENLLRLVPGLLSLKEGSYIKDPIDDKELSVSILHKTEDFIIARVSLNVMGVFNSDCMEIHIIPSAQRIVVISNTKETYHFVSDYENLPDDCEFSPMISADDVSRETQDGIINNETQENLNQSLASFIQESFERGHVISHSTHC